MYLHLHPSRYSSGTRNTSIRIPISTPIKRAV